MAILISIILYIFVIESARIVDFGKFIFVAIILFCIATLIGFLYHISGIKTSQIEQNSIHNKCSRFVQFTRKNRKWP